MGPSEALLRGAVVFYISSENRCARCYVPRINHDHRIHPQKKTRGQRGTNNNIIRSYEFLEMSFPPPPKKPPKRSRRRRRCPNARRTEHGQVINNATPREGEGETETELRTWHFITAFRGIPLFFASSSLLLLGASNTCKMHAPHSRGHPLRCASVPARRPEEESQYRRHVSRDKPQRGRVGIGAGLRDRFRCLSRRMNCGPNMDHPRQKSASGDAMLARLITK